MPLYRPTNGSKCYTKPKIIIQLNVCIKSAVSLWSYMRSMACNQNKVWMQWKLNHFVPHFNVWQICFSFSFTLKWKSFLLLTQNRSERSDTRLKYNESILKLMKSNLSFNWVKSGYTHCLNTCDMARNELTIAQL